MPQALEYLHLEAEQIGRYDRRATTSVGTAASLVCSDLANSVLSASEMANAAVLIEDGANAGEQGMLANSPLTKSTGALATADSFTTAIASGVTFSLYSADRLPAYRRGDRPGLLQRTNRALSQVSFEDTLTIAGVSSQIHYTIDTTTYPWLTDDTRIIDVQYPVTASDDVPVALPRELWSWVADGETRRLRFPTAPFATGQSFTVKVRRPGNSRLKQHARLRAVLTATAVTSVAIPVGGYYTALPTIAASSGAATFTAVMAATPGPITSVTVTGGGAYAAGFPPALVVTRNASDTGWRDMPTQTGGLETLTDEAIPDVELVAAATLALAFESLAELGAPGQTVAEWLVKADRWQKRADEWARTAPRDPDEGVARLPTALVGGRGRRWASR